MVNNIKASKHVLNVILVFARVRESLYYLLGYLSVGKVLGSMVLEPVIALA